MALNLVYLAIIAALGSALLPILFLRSTVASKFITFILLGISGFSGILGGGMALLGKVDISAELPIGLPWLRCHLHLDPLSGFFLFLVSLISLIAAIYGPAYVREYQQGPQPLLPLTLFTGLFVAGMDLVMLADDAFSFMIAWELMSVSSYFLVAYQHQNETNRSAAFIYLLMAQIGGLFILLGYGVLASFSGAFDFSSMQAVELSPAWSSLAFVLALIGFGMKAGIVPLHVWLPQAHPVAPSHISALMSGVMLKVAIYGFIRFVYDLLGNVYWQWGVAVLSIGCISAILGVLYALMQHDLKRLLAYHSVENIGIIYMGLGLS
ncbi:MAG: proton-conducting transporter membrane subunit, partial [Desulfuromusa sp.]|nr:proton-conducting transporter membrane subunit [Desulfuromusa sp.]